MVINNSQNKHTISIYFYYRSQSNIFCEATLFLISISCNIPSAPINFHILLYPIYSKNQFICTNMKREPNFEILRTLAMLFIVIGHFIIHGITFVSNHQATFVNMSSAWGISNFVILEYLVYITGTGVNCFVMISGYFLVKSESWRIKY